MKIDVINKEMKKVEQVELKEKVFEAKEQPGLWHQVVRWQLACKRKGNAKSKERSDVKGSTRKIYRQKGTGRARHGSLKAPIFRSGGVVFGPRARSYAYALPRKTKRLALCSALSMKREKDLFRVVDSLEVEEVKTKKAKTMLDAFGFGSALIVDESSQVLSRAVRNLKNFKLVRSHGLNLYDLLKFDGVIVTKESLEKIQEALG